MNAGQFFGAARNSFSLLFTGNAARSNPSTDTPTPNGDGFDPQQYEADSNRTSGRALFGGLAGSVAGLATVGIGMAKLGAAATTVATLGVAAAALAVGGAAGFAAWKVADHVFAQN